MRTKKLFAIWACSASLLSSCSSIPIPNARICGVSGVFAAGMDCTKILTGEISQMNVNETLDWLEPSPQHPDPSDPTKIIPARGAAICQSVDDWNAFKTALEQACTALGDKCDREAKSNFEWAKYSSSSLQKTTRDKAIPLERRWRPREGELVIP